jgi:hypothetical protein
MANRGLFQYVIGFYDFQKFDARLRNSALLDVAD